MERGTHRCTLVVDRHPGASPFPKATGVSTGTMEIFRGWGLEDQAARRRDTGTGGHSR